jgi:hypothetical protein
MSDTTIPSVTFQNNQVGTWNPWLIVGGSESTGSALPAGGALTVSPVGVINANYTPGNNALTLTPVTPGVSVGTVVITYTDPGTNPTSVSIQVVLTQYVPSLALAPVSGFSAQ